MDIETRLTNLENLVNSLIKSINSNKFYTDADIAGCRKGISEVTPYTETKTVYIGDTEVMFTDVPQGNMSVFINASDGSCPKFGAVRSEDVVIVSFEELETTATVTISIM